MSQKAGHQADSGIDLWPDENAGADDDGTGTGDTKPVSNGHDNIAPKDAGAGAEPINKNTPPPKAHPKSDEETQAEVERRLFKLADNIIADVQPKAWRLPGPVSPGVVQRWRAAAQAVELFTNHLAKHRA